MVHTCMLNALIVVSSGPGDLRVSKQNFEEAFKKVRPSVSKEVSALNARAPETIILICSDLKIYCLFY